ncbi:NUDIX hydrolase [Arthrobacter crystallopoietes]|uniref:ADP-ribose pyrophosphatase YjhB, NUDIX family n=1 Tax=Crystallibacter crystallopoietes TaxID=37928 RepID=A0A1H1A0E3_9MICC|nr:NUDIX domain-containing protein [Arthrobacter crystallopoietes]AUI51735.1 NUDIX hydrolase [Arthrobacter crystallopoietes]SDQ33135.1 ADP-ribose pyrophosphatase YjhB, NUDIX family [Arthrobacter crystallopoietes]
MPTPDFILQLREKIGQDLLWLPGATAVVLDDRDRVLLGRRADNGIWTLITGILEPGEQPAVGIVREVFEETGVVAEVEHLAEVFAGGPMEFVNGDQAQFLTLNFRCRYISGEARVNDDESSAVGWFALGDLPELPDYHRARLSAALRANGVPEFVR